ncbi:hypothetical protein ACLMPM_24440 [Yersinia enterocolitica]|uniref:hypothetical protein n=1 Tax=Yersinia enterocolitica TaxID=630 RepID=UPI00398D35BE
MPPAILPDKEPVADPVGLNRSPRFTPKKAQLLKHFVYTVAVLGIVTSGVLNLALYVHFSNMTVRLESLEAAFISGQLSQLASTAVSLEKHIAEQEQRFSLKQDVIADIKTLSEQVLNQDRKVDQLATNLGEEKKALLRQSEEMQVHQQELSALKAGIETLKVKIEKWLPTSKNKPFEQKKSKPISSPTSQKTTRTEPLAVPFVLTGIERRGGQIYAVITPHKTPLLSQIQLLAPGDSAGGWTLRSAQGNEALFMVNGVTQRVIAR